jgi:transcriptional regulator with XRE-family HTH domain
MYMPGLPQRLKDVRTRAGFTQKDVEARLGLRELAMKDFETGRLKLPASMALSLAKLYGVTVDELMGEAPRREASVSQVVKLSQLDALFSLSDFSLLFMDPVIRAYLEEYRDQILDHSLFDLLSRTLTPRQKYSLAIEMLRVLASLMGVDDKITKEELDFLHRLIRHFGLEQKSKVILKSAGQRYQPSFEHFQNRAEARHFLLWLLFFIAKSDGDIGPLEMKFIEECAESLRIHRSAFLFVKKFFVKEKF